jgi:hypothetical protein
MSLKRKISSLTTYISILALLAPVLAVVLSQPANAAILTNTYIRLNRMKSGTGTTFRVVFKAASSQTAQVAVDFNGTDVGAAQWTNATPGGLVTTGAVTTSTAQCVTDGFTALPGVTSATGAGSVITTSGVTATTSGSTYCVDFTTAAAVTTPTAGHEGEYHPTITQGTDSTTVAVRIIANDQIVVTATVPPTFNFVLSGNTDAFSSSLVGSSYTSTAGKTVTITTNAATGWITWVKDLNGSSGASTKGALKSAAASNYTIPTTNANALGSASHTAAGANTEDYGLGVTITTDAGGGGTVALDPAYDGTSSKLGVLDPNNFRPVASSGGTANGDVITLTERAQISAGATPAATDYTDTLTVIGAGAF